MGGMLALDWVDALLILAGIYGIYGLGVWLLDDPGWIEGGGRAAILPVLSLPVLRRYLLGVPLREVRDELTTGGVAATLAIVFGSLIAAAGLWTINARASMEPPISEVVKHEAYIKEHNATMLRIIAEDGIDVSSPEDLPPEHRSALMKPADPEQIRIWEAGHEEEMRQFEIRRADGIWNGIKVGAGGFFVLVLGGILDSRRKLVPPTDAPPPTEQEPGASS